MHTNLTLSTQSVQQPAPVLSKAEKQLEEDKKAVTNPQQHTPTFTPTPATASTLGTSKGGSECIVSFLIDNVARLLRSFPV
jgi:hypothetical protein